MRFPSFFGEHRRLKDRRKKSRTTSTPFHLEPLECRALMAVLSHVPIVGDVTDTSAKVWFRTNDNAKNVEVQYSVNADLSGSVKTAKSNTIKDNNYTGIHTLTGLQPETTYYYRVLIRGVPQQTGNYPSFTTFAPDNATRTFSFVVTADVSDHADDPAPVYQTIAEEESDAKFYMQIGDWDHRDPGSLKSMRRMHREMRGPGSVHGEQFAQHIAPNFPLYHVWDDHDYGDNNADKTFGDRTAALRAFKEYFPTPALANPAGIWHSFDYAQADFFMLDLRSQRDPVKDAESADKSMLDGDNIANGQKDWLKAGLLNSDATWKFVITSVPFNPTVTKKDGWAEYDNERQEIVDFIETNNIEGVILISADMHYGGAIDDGTNSTFPELQLPHTNLTDRHNTTSDPGTWSEGIDPAAGPNANAGYAVVTVSADEVLLEIKGVDGQVRKSYTVSLSGTASELASTTEESEEPVVATSTTTQPNIVIYVTDDQRLDSLQFMPLLNQQLAQNGTVFNNAFVTTALSGPSRASILSGQYAHNHGVLNNGRKEGGFNHFEPNTSIAKVLQDAGYHTGLFGKYINHYDGGLVTGWNEIAASDKPGAYNYDLYVNGRQLLFGSDPDDYFTDVIAEYSEEYVRDREANDEQPFFLYVASNAPHKPATPAERHENLFPDLKAPRPPSFNEADVSDKPAWVREQELLSSKAIKKIDKQYANVARSLQAVDEAILGLMDTLRETGELENTVIMFISDNGLLFGEHRHNEKKAAYEEGIRVPLVIYDGRNPVRRDVNDYALNIDLAPTIAELAGLEKPIWMDGESLVPFIDGVAPTSWRDDFLVEHYTTKTEEHFALRNQQYLYVEYRTGELELYDLGTDPYQLESLHDEPGYQSLIETLSVRLAQLKAI